MSEWEKAKVAFNEGYIDAAMSHTDAAMAEYGFPPAEVWLIAAIRGFYLLQHDESKEAGKFIGLAESELEELEATEEETGLKPSSTALHQRERFRKFMALMLIREEEMKTGEKWVPASRISELEAKIGELTRKVEKLKGDVEYYKKDRDYYLDRYLERSRPEPEPERAPTRPAPMTYQSMTYQQYEEGIGDLGAGELLMRTASR